MSSFYNHNRLDNFGNVIHNDFENIFLDRFELDPVRGTPDELNLNYQGNEILSVNENGDLIVSGDLSISGNTTFDDLTINGDLTVDTNTLIVDSTNNRVGIGITNPLANLQVESSGNTAVVCSSSSNLDVVFSLNTPLESGNLKLTAANGNVSIGAPGEIFRCNQADDFVEVLGANTNFIVDTDRFVVDSTRNIGIGLTNPSEILDISANNLDIINFKGSGSSNRLHLVIGDSDNELQIGKAGANNDFFTGTIDGDAIFRSNSNNLHLGAGLTLSTITLDTNLNVGIKTTTPNVDLQIHDPSTTSSFIQLTNTSSGSTVSDGALIGLSTTELNIQNQETGGINFFNSSSDKLIEFNDNGEIRLGVSSNLHNSTGGSGNVVAGQLPMIELQRAGTDQTISSGSFTTITYTSTSINRGGFSEASGVITVPTNGVYLINAQFTWASNSTGIREMIVIQGGILDRVIEIITDANSSTFHGMNGSAIVRITNQATQTLTLIGCQTSGGNLNLISSNAALPTIFSIIRISDI